MIIDFKHSGMYFIAEVNYTPGYSGSPSYGHPDNAFPGEDSDLEFETLECDGKDASFLLDSDLEDGIFVAALNAADKQFNEKDEP
jgi:hypothetical protein